MSPIRFTLAALLALAPLLPAGAHAPVAAGGATTRPTTPGPTVTQVDNPAYPEVLGSVPAQNWGVYLGYTGHIDTNLSFVDFFGDDHTITAWFMPQYPYANSGPIVAENGGGTFAFGQENYRSGDGGNGDAGNAVFFVQVGAQKVIYLLPSMRAGKWMHVAVVRKDDTFSLYVDGTKRTPVRIVDRAANTTAAEPELHVTSSAGGPTGTLRIGRRTTGTGASNRAWQTYGIVDDIAVFDRALTRSAIEAIRSAKRLTGHETGLIAGWSFEAPANGKVLPPRLARPWTKQGRSYHRVISKTRTDADASLLDNPLLVGALSTDVQLPFPKNEVWRVIQGQDDPGGSHNGSAAFTYDFMLAGQPQTGTYPKGTAHAPVYAGATGRITSYRRDGSFSGPREPYFMRIRVAEGEELSYLHLDGDSITADAHGGTCNADHDCAVPLADAETIQRGEEVAELGPKAAHLHFGGRNDETTIPVAFTNYWVSTDQGATWTQVFRGHPQAGQWIKRTQ